MSVVHHQPVSELKRGRARSLRRHMTDAEAKLWRMLRGRRFVAFKCRRQVPFRSYILDFVCFEAKIVVEVDGSQHADSKADSTRDALLRAEGFRTLRYWNSDVLLHPDVVAEDIFSRLRATPHPAR
jgi:very-short-patch-repair endonuclease